MPACRSLTKAGVYFDDLKVTHTKSNVIQYNEFYNHGSPNANSWTRENSTGNNFLANGGTELNTTSSLYDLDFRNFDPILGRMHQVDPMAAKYGSATPYNFSFNNPVSLNDPSGADPFARDDYWREMDMQNRARRSMGSSGGVANDLSKLQRAFGVSLSFGALSYSQEYRDQMKQDALYLTTEQYAEKYGQVIYSSGQQSADIAASMLSPTIHSGHWGYWEDYDYKHGTGDVALEGTRSKFINFFTGRPRNNHSPLSQWFLDNAATIATVIGASANAYAGWNEFRLGEAMVLNIEAAPMSTVFGGYLIADGLARMISAPIQIAGAIKKNDYYKNYPGNLLGIIGFLNDNKGNSRSNMKSGGYFQTAGEIIGDFGFGKVEFIRSIEKVITSPTFLNNVDMVYKLIEPYVKPLLKLFEEN